MKKLILGLILSLSAPALACYNDFDCGFGNQCLKAYGNYGAGICTVSVNQYGNPVNQRQRMKPRTVEGCSWDTDCEYGESCVKRSGDLYGICVR